MARLGLAVAVTVVAFAADAHAIRVRLPPGPRDVCPKATSWDRLRVCLKPFGTLTEVRAIAGAKIFDVEHDGERKRFIYTLAGDTWRFGNELSAEADVVDLVAFTGGGKTRYRADLVETDPAVKSFADESSVPARVIRRSTHICPGDGPCVEIITGCDEIVRGRTTGIFRGTLEIAGATGSVRGDRSKAGTSCFASEDAFTLW